MRFMTVVQCTYNKKHNRPLFRTNSTENIKSEGHYYLQQIGIASIVLSTQPFIIMGTLGFYARQLA